MARSSAWSIGIGILCVSLLAELLGPKSTHPRLASGLLIALGVAMGAALLGWLLVRSILEGARMSTGTIVYPDGLLLRQALWQTRFVSWDQIVSVEMRNSTGWNYLHLRTPGGSPGPAMCLDVDDPLALAEAIGRAAPADSPLRTVFRPD